MDISLKMILTTINMAGSLEAGSPGMLGKYLLQVCRNLGTELSSEGMSPVIVATGYGVTSSILSGSSGKILFRKDFHWLRTLLPRLLRMFARTWRPVPIMQDFCDIEVHLKLDYVSHRGTRLRATWVAYSSSRHSIDCRFDSLAQ